MVGENDRQDEPKTPDTRSRPVSTGTNARPRDETIAQTGPGIPNDTSSPVEIDPEEEKRLEDKIRSL